MPRDLVGSTGLSTRLDPRTFGRSSIPIIACATELVEAECGTGRGQNSVSLRMQHGSGVSTTYVVRAALYQAQVSEVVWMVSSQTFQVVE